MRRRTKQKLCVFFAVAATVVALPVLLPWALITHSLDKRRLLKAARKTDCPICCTRLGEKSFDLADTVRSKDSAELHRANPGVKFRLVRMYDLICTNGNTRLKIDQSSQTLSPVNDNPDVETES